MGLACSVVSVKTQRCLSEPDIIWVLVKGQTGLGGPVLIPALSQMSDQPVGTGLICGLIKKADLPMWAWPNWWLSQMAD